MSLINLMLKNPDVFCFADYACHTVVVDILKTPPDEENRDIATWWAANAPTKKKNWHIFQFNLID